jgi:hypothetical protein
VLVSIHHQVETDRFFHARYKPIHSSIIILHRKDDWRNLHRQSVADTCVQKSQKGMPGHEYLEARSSHGIFEAILDFGQLLTSPHPAISFKTGAYSICYSRLQADIYQDFYTLFSAATRHAYIPDHATQ